MANKSHIGSDFDQFLREEGLLEDSSAVALKRVIAWQLGEAMKSQRVTKSEMATRMGTSRSQLDRVLGASGEGGGMTLETLGRALDALGLRVRLEMHGDPTARKRAVHKTKVRRHGERVKPVRDRDDKRAHTVRRSA
ncbi:MAG TPA: Fis family transcriptional regulator [bacterium]|nr:Fis family transcriptional regulator [bacterium]